MTRQRKQSLGKTPPIIFVILFGIVVLVVILAIGLSGREGRPISQLDDRRSPEIVHDRVVTAMQNEDPQALFREINPSLQNMFTIDSLQKAQEESEQEQGRITKVEVLRPPTLLTGTEWNNRWAEALVQITRDRSVGTYIVRYYQDNGKWWLMGTIER